MLEPLVTGGQEAGRRDDMDQPVRPGPAALLTRSSRRVFKPYSGGVSARYTSRPSDTNLIT
jgi:hypothetical protein